MSIVPNTIMHLVSYRVTEPQSYERFIESFPGDRYRPIVPYLKEAVGSIYDTSSLRVK